jgi:[NiFe] hydrogenase diaphorase moiety large subunit
MRAAVRDIVERHLGERRQLLAILRAVQEKWRCVSEEAITFIAEEMDLPRVHVEGTATFYHFLSREHRGDTTVYLNTSATSEMAGGAEVAAAFERTVGTSFGTTTADKRIGLYKTSCIGMSDQEPAALINEVVFTRLTPARVDELVAGIQAGRAVRDLLGPLGDGRNATPEIHAEVRNNIQRPGPVFFAPFTPGAALARALDVTSLDVIESVKRSGLRGRGGAGFSTGQKWASCRGTEAESRYVLCNADEGEPGTFKDRVILTECPEQMFEGMTVAGYAVEATRGLLYCAGVRSTCARIGEGPPVHARAAPAREAHPGKPLQLRHPHQGGRGRLHLRRGIGLDRVRGGQARHAEESSALPGGLGYRHRPTIVNNVETFGCASRIVEQG